MALRYLCALPLEIKPLWNGADAELMRGVEKKNIKKKTPPFMMRLKMNQLQVSSIQSLVMRNRGDVVRSAVKITPPGEQRRRAPGKMESSWRNSAELDIATKRS